MAKKSKIAKNEQRKVIVERYAEKRAQLKKTLIDPNASDEEREAARVGLQKLPATQAPSASATATASTAAPRHVPEVRHQPHPLPQHGSQRRAPRHHQVLLVTA